MDHRFKVEVISQTSNPQQVCYAAMHQDYAEHMVVDTRQKWPNEQKSGELIVKHLLKGNRGHYGCYSADTEVLTIDGWKAWPEVDRVDKLLAVDIETNTCHFERPYALQKHQLKAGDQLYVLESQHLNFQVTLDHRMVVSHRKKTGEFTGWYFKSASDVIGKPVRYLLNSCLDDFDRTISELPENIDPLAAFKIAGFFFGDGLRTKNINPRSIGFKICRPKKIAYLLSIGLPAAKKEGDRYTIKHAELTAWVYKWFSSPSGKTVPLWLLTLPMDLIAAFWDGLKNSDGAKITEKSWAYDSCEKTALDIIQATAHINGFSANITLNNPNEGLGHKNHRPCWRLCIIEHSTRRVETCHKDRSPGIAEELINYAGSVYCASVSTGALMVRRNNKVFVSGNCLEHPQIVFNFGYFPHSTMQQMRTHRNVSFDVQCLAGESLVSTAAKDGKLIEIPIEQLAKYSDLPMGISLDEDKGCFWINQIEKVLTNPNKELHLVTFWESDKELKCTLDHQIMTPDGWRRLESLSAGDSVYCTDHYVGDDMCVKPHVETIKAITYLRNDVTYDLVMKAPHHNFVCNGVVVHNSFRYTGQRILDVISGKQALEDVFYLRPVGSYADRQGKKYDYTAQQRQQDLDWCMEACHRYAERIEQGLAEEHARGLIPFDVRQHWVMSANARSLMHLLDIRGKYDVQLETRVMTEMMFEHFQNWMPEVAAWYEKARWRKGTLAP